MNGVFRKEEETRKRIREICDFAGVPYCDVLCSKKNGEVFRCIYGENATEKEYLRMYSCSKPVTAIARRAECAFSAKPYAEAVIRLRI